MKMRYDIYQLTLKIFILIERIEIRSNSNEQLETIVEIMKQKTSFICLSQAAKYPNVYVMIAVNLF